MTATLEALNAEIRMSSVELLQFYAASTHNKFRFYRPAAKAELARRGASL
jgi:hypothetical protein